MGNLGGATGRSDPSCSKENIACNSICVQKNALKLGHYDAVDTHRCTGELNKCEINRDISSAQGGVTAGNNISDHTYPSGRANEHDVRQYYNHSDDEQKLYCIACNSGVTLPTFQHRLAINKIYHGIRVVFSCSYDADGQVVWSRQWK